MKQCIPILILTFLFLTLEKESIYGQEIIFSDGFEDGTLKTQWTARPNLTGTDGVAEIKFEGELSGIAHSGSAGFAFGKTESGVLTTNALDLTLDLSSFNNSELEFSFWFNDNADETHFEDGIFISDDGGLNFHRIFAFEPSRWSGYGSFVPLDLDSLIRQEGLSMTSNFVIRFQQRGEKRLTRSGGSQNYEGIFIDDIELKVAEPVIAISNLPYTNNFETGLEQEWKINNPYLIGGTADEEHITQSWEVKIFEGEGRGSGSALGLGKFTSNNGENVSALDLYLDLTSYLDSELEFSFWFNDNADETHFEDGIFISDDGGLNFHRIFAFEPSRWSGYGSFVPLDLDSLIRQEGLSMTSNFVIRFQQRGEKKFTNSGGSQNYEGIFIDDILIRVADSPIFSTLPLSYNFETQNLGSDWKVVNPSFLGNTANDQNITPSGLVELFGSEGVNTSRGLALGKSTDNNGSNTSAIDLYADLRNAQNVELEFDIRDFFNENNSESGIYISVDSAKSFTKIYNFDFTNLEDNEYENILLDVSQLAEDNSLSLHGGVIFRFQQSGTGDFSTSGDEDGIYLDNVEVRALTTPSDITLSTSIFDENLSVGTSIIDLATTDLDGDTDHVYTLVSGDGDTDNNAFKIEGDKLITSNQFDFENKSNYSIRIRTTDPHDLFYEESFNLSVIDVNEVPTALTVSSSNIDENTAAGVVIGSFTTTDVDAGDSHSYSLVLGDGDDDNSSFEIQNNQLLATAAFDFETKNELSILIRTTDSGGLILDQNFTIQVNDVNEAPTTISMSPASVAENVAVGTEVGQLSTEDPDANDSHSFALVAGSGDIDNALFSIEGATLITAAELDYESKNEFIIRVKSTDADGLSLEGNLSVSLTNVEEPNITLAGNLNFDPTALQLNSELSFTISNDNDDGVLEVSGISVPDGFSVSGTSFSIAEQSSQLVTVTFSPLEQQTYSGQLVVNSNAGEATLSISGEGAVITSLEELPNLADDLLIYPNPVSNELRLIIPSVFRLEDSEISFRSATGGIVQSLKSPSENQVNLDVSTEANGLYLITISDGVNTVTKKVIIKK